MNNKIINGLTLLIIRLVAQLTIENELIDFFSAILISVGIELFIESWKIYNLNKNGTIRANISVGVGYTILKEPENWQFIESDSWINLSENYTYSYRTYDTMSLIINPKIEFPLTNFIGLSVSPMIKLNKDRTYYGIGFGTMLGKLK